MRLLIATLSLAALATAGCGGEDPFAPSKRGVNTGAFGVVGGVDELAGEPAGKAADNKAGQAADDTAGKAAPEAAPAPKTPPPAPLKKAEVGVGKKGHYGGPGIIKTPVSVYFRAQERIIFNVEIPNNMKLYKAMHDNKGPATQEEFMEKIIKASNIHLPELPPGERYIYDPAKEELFIEQPQK
jgi:hypothetical protein